MASLRLVAAPTVEPASLAEAKDQLAVTTADWDTLVTRLITAARQYVERVTGSALVNQTWDQSLDAFPPVTHRNPSTSIEVLRRPLSSVTSIKYVDTSGVTQTVATADYLVDTASVPSRIAPAYGKTWPAAREQLNTVTVRFVAGYGAAAADVPDDLRHAVLVALADLFEHRESVVTGTIVSHLPTVDRLLASFHLRAMQVA